ncbi:MAG TPA: MAPEG family protein [Caulobacteraceae bacterium]|nr:MAPEG family protein [Caulobacteraceae bacterium]
MDDFTPVAAVTLISLLVYFWLGMRVGQARSRHGVPAPATTGNEDFERVFRAHQNTLEWLPMYLVSLWLFALYWSVEVAALLGLVWIVGRILYGLGYAKAAGSRSTGFLIQALAVGVLLFGALGRIVWMWLQAG